MSHVSDNPQNASGVLFLFKLKGNADHYRVMRKVNETHIMLTWNKFKTMARMKKMLCMYKNA